MTNRVRSRKLGSPGASQMLLTCWRGHALFVAVMARKAAQHSSTLSLLRRGQRTSPSSYSRGVRFLENTRLQAWQEKS
jgi:hypothetical protein